MCTNAALTLMLLKIPFDMEGIVGGGGGEICVLQSMLSEGKRERERKKKSTSTLTNDLTSNRRNIERKKNLNQLY